MPTASALLGPIESDPEDEKEGESICKRHTFTLDASCLFTHPTVILFIDFEPGPSDDEDEDEDEGK